MPKSDSAPGHRPPTFEDTPFVRLGKEVSQHPETRRDLIRKLEGVYGGKVITFFTCFHSLGGMIDDGDAEMLESVLSAESGGKKITLVLNSPGGMALAAERFVNVCRTYSGGNFDVIVPHMAKSAATMICFGANTIHMSKTAELGPVDPQQWYPDDKGNSSSISAQEYIGSYRELMALAMRAGDKNIEPCLQQLQRYDARLVKKLESAQKLSEDISIRLLSSGMMNKTSRRTIRKRIAPFLLQEIKKSHGRMISLDEATACGLSVSPIDLRSDLWRTVWELYVRTSWAVEGRRCKVIESAESAVSTKGMMTNEDQD